MLKRSRGDITIRLSCSMMTQRILHLIRNSPRDGWGAISAHVAYVRQCHELLVVLPMVSLNHIISKIIDLDEKFKGSLDQYSPLRKPRPIQSQK